MSNAHCVGPHTLQVTHKVTWPFSSKVKSVYVSVQRSAMLNWFSWLEMHHILGNRFTEPLNYASHNERPSFSYWQQHIRGKTSTSNKCYSRLLPCHMGLQHRVALHVWFGRVLCRIRLLTQLQKTMAYFTDLTLGSNGSVMESLHSGVTLFAVTECRKHPYCNSTATYFRYSTVSYPWAIDFQQDNAKPQIACIKRGLLHTGRIQMLN